MKDSHQDFFNLGCSSSSTGMKGDLLLPPAPSKSRVEGGSNGIGGGRKIDDGAGPVRITSGGGSDGIGGGRRIDDGASPV